MITYIAFLSKYPNKCLINFAEKLSEYYKVFIIIDDNSKKYQNNNTKVTLIQINNEICIENNYKYALEMFYNNVKNNDNTRKVLAKDKAIYYFLNKDINFDNIWFIEDDVFISSVNLFKTLNENYQNSDLLCSHNSKGTKIEAEKREWFWNYAIHIFGEPSYCTMACCIRVSNNLLKIVDNVIKTLKFIPFHEFLFTTLANKYNLIINTSYELSNIKYTEKWTIEDFKKNKNIIYHPVKDFDNHDNYRIILENY